MKHLAFGFRIEIKAALMGREYITGAQCNGNSFFVVSPHNHVFSSKVQTSIELLNYNPYLNTH